MQNGKKWLTRDGCALDSEVEIDAVHMIQNGQP